MGAKRTYGQYGSYCLWTIAVMQFSIFTTGMNLTTGIARIPADPGHTGYAWSSWGSWSPCSRSCGGGVAVQERHCLPWTGNNTSGESSLVFGITAWTRHACVGVAKRYHECNTMPCTRTGVDMRSEQCSAYDRRPFRGRFYTWVPYIDGNSPCMLNCRPLGQQFYASLSLVIDGTPCTMPGHRAICVQGTCQVSHYPSLYVSLIFHYHCYNFYSYRFISLG